jgi:hypothetical protein
MQHAEAARTRLGQRLPGEAGLADADLPSDQHNGAGPQQRAVDRVAEDPPFGLPADQPRHLTGQTGARHQSSVPGIDIAKPTQVL